MPKKLQEQINKIKKSIIDKNIPDDSVATFGKLQELEHSLYRYNELSKAGLKNEAKTEKSKVANLVDYFNETEDGTVLKGGISNTRYVWVAEEGACDECMELNGSEYEFEGDAPFPLHPNCKCSIEMVEDEGSDDSDDDEEPCDCYETISDWFDECEELCGEYEGALDEADSPMDELQSISDYIQNYTDAEIEEIEELQDKLNQLIENAVNELTDIIDQAVSTIQIFKENFDDLTDLSKELGHYLDYSAEYYHTKANCEAAQLGDVGAEMATFLGYLRELYDFPKEILGKGYTVKDAFEHSVHDLKMNEIGREIGKEHPNEPPEVIIPKPEGMPPDFW